LLAYGENMKHINIVSDKCPKCKELNLPHQLYVSKDNQYFLKYRCRKCREVYVKENTPILMVSEIGRRRL